MSNMEAVRQIMGELRNFRSSQDEKIENMDAQIGAIKDAQRLLEESVYRGSDVEINSSEDAMKKFVGEDGRIRWTAGKTKIRTTKGVETVTEYGLLDTPEICSDWHRQLKRLANERTLVRSMLIGHNKSTPKLDLALRRHLAVAPRTIKASVEKANYDGSGVGAELIADQFLRELHMEFEVPTVVRSLFSEVQMQSGTLLAPRVNRGGRPYIKGIVTSDIAGAGQYPASTVQTGQSTITAKGLACRYVLDEELVEDSAVLLLPAMQRMIAKDLRDAIEDALLNGDAAATHQDDIADWNIRERWGTSPALGGSNDHRKLWTGLRAQAYDRTTQFDFQTSATASKILQLFSKMSEFAASDKVLIVSPEVMFEHLMGLDQVITLEKFGASASILNGQLASVFGTPIVVSRFLSSDLNANGKYTGSGSTTGMVLVSRESYQIFARRGVNLVQEQDITTGAYNMVATERLTFDTLDAADTKNVAYGFNLS
jgi:HK97 family phage major capsid protein